MFVGYGATPIPRAFPRVCFFLQNSKTKRFESIQKRILCIIPNWLRSPKKIRAYEHKIPTIWALIRTRMQSISRIHEIYLLMNQLYKDYTQRGAIGVKSLRDARIQFLESKAELDDLMKHARTTEVEMTACVNCGRKFVPGGLPFLAGPQVVGSHLEYLLKAAELREEQKAVSVLEREVKQRLKNEAKAEAKLKRLLAQQERSLRKVPESKEEPPEIKQARLQRLKEQEERMLQYERDNEIEIVGYCGREDCCRYSRKLRFTDPQTIVACTAGCRIAYHSSCYKRCVEKFEVPICLTSECLTPDCEGQISSIKTVDLPNKREHWILKPVRGEGQIGDAIDRKLEQKSVETIPLAPQIPIPTFSFSFSMPPVAASFSFSASVAQAVTTVTSAEVKPPEKKVRKVKPRLKITEFVPGAVYWGAPPDLEPGAINEDEGPEPGLTPQERELLNQGLTLTPLNTSDKPPPKPEVSLRVRRGKPKIKSGEVTMSVYDFQINVDAQAHFQAE